jgi:hypothetical protein
VPITGLHHVDLAVSDTARSLDFDPAGIRLEVAHWPKAHPALDA